PAARRRSCAMAAMRASSRLPAEPAPRSMTWRGCSAFRGGPSSGCWNATAAAVEATEARLRVATLMSMPTVKVQPETYAVFERLAAREGRGVDETAEDALEHFLAFRQHDAARNREFDQALARIRADLPTNKTLDEIEADIDLAIDEAWA